MTTTVEQLDIQQAQPGDGQRWRGLIALIGEATSDGRIFDSVTWRDLPLTLLYQPETADGHDGAVPVGRIDRITIRGAELWGEGVFAVATDDYRWPQVALDLVRDQVLKGVSVDAAALDMRDGEDGLRHFDAEIGALTLVAFPAFARASIELVDTEMPDPTDVEALPYATETLDAGSVPSDVPTVAFEPTLGLVASAATCVPAAMFAQPETTRRERLHVESDGHVWGHIYGWGECHIGSPPGRCIQPPPSSTAYAYFLTGAVLTDDGEIAVGQIVLSADHAPLTATWGAARDHYANTALAVADVTCGEDEYGIWVSGMLRPGTPDEMIHTLRASSSSGDWRPVGRALELVAILAVNTPGYPAFAAHVEQGRVTALVASGTPASDCGCGGSTELSDVLARLAAVEGDLAPIRAAAADERDVLIAGWEAELGVDSASQIAAMEAELG